MNLRMLRSSTWHCITRRLVCCCSLSSSAADKSSSSENPPLLSIDTPVPTLFIKKPPLRKPLLRGAGPA